MFDHTCSVCEQRSYVFPSQVTSVTNTDHGIVVHLTCWCGAEQTLLTGRRSETAAA